jgi:hypothetical protein
VRRQGRRRRPLAATVLRDGAAALPRHGVAADPAFATGFLFFVVTIVLALPGAAIVAWEGLRRTRAS